MIQGLLPGKLVFSKINIPLAGGGNIYEKHIQEK
jgi:hypothetical protein